MSKCPCIVFGPAVLDTFDLDGLCQRWRGLQRQNEARVMVRVTKQPLSLMRRSGFEAAMGGGQIAEKLDAALVGAAALVATAQNRA